MEIDPKAAQASLADIGTVVARLTQSSFYRRTSTIIVVWGILAAAGYLICQWLPRQAVIVWPVNDAIGLVAIIVMGWRQQRTYAGFDWRIVVAIVLIFGFGYICAALGHFGPRELSVFWPILFMLGYALAGLWLGRAYVILAVAVTLLALAGYFFVDTWFQLYLAVVNGGGLILAGLWLRRA